MDRGIYQCSEVDKAKKQVDCRPIGIFDSGLGGLSVWRALREELPDESFIYYGDGVNCPYGNRSREEVCRLSEQAVEWLLTQDVKMIVVACNTATAAAVTHLRSKYGVPFIGMEPAVKPAALSTSTGVVGVLATEGSLQGELFQVTSARYGENVRILTSEGTGFVEMVERGLIHGEQAVKAVAGVVEPLLSEGVDRLVLGCTHYPFLAEVIRTIIGDREVEIVDPSPAVARQARRILEQEKLLTECSAVRNDIFYSPAGVDYVAKMKNICSVADEKSKSQI